MDERRLEEIADAWIAYQEIEKASPDDGEEHWWAVSEVTDWWLDDDSQTLWQFIQTVHKRDLSAAAAACLAAGPLEDLLSMFGPQYITEVERLASEDAKFNWLLGGVWRNSMSEEVWQRLQTIRKAVW